MDRGVTHGLAPVLPAPTHGTRAHDGPTSAPMTRDEVHSLPRLTVISSPTS